MSDSSLESISSYDDANEVPIDWLGILWRRKGWILLGIILGVGAAAQYLAMTPPTYRSKMEILVGQRSGSLAKAGGSNGEVEGTQAESDVLSTHIQLFTSRRIVAAAIEAANLTDLASLQKVISNKGSPIAFIQGHLRVSKGGKGVAKDAHTLTAAYESLSPVDGAIVLRAVFDQYAAYLKEHVEGTSTEAIDLLTKLATENSEALRTAEKKLSESMSSTDLLWDGNSTQNVHKDRLRRVEAELSDLDAEQNSTVSRLTVIQEYLEQNQGKEVSDLGWLALLSETEVGRLKLLFDVTKNDASSEAFQAEAPIRQETARVEYNKYLELVMREKMLTEKFNDGHPSVISVREQLEVLKTFIDAQSAKLQKIVNVDRVDPEEMLATYIALLEYDVAEGVKKREVLLARSRQELKAAKVLEAAEIKVGAIRNELGRYQSMFDGTHATIRELNFVRDYAGYATDVIGDVQPWGNPVGPNTATVLFIGLFTGSGFGFLVAFMVDLFDTTFSDSSDVSRTFGIPVLAHIPQFPKIKESREDGLLPMHPTVYSFHRPRSKESEVFRIIRTSVVASLAASEARILQITSPAPNDGKSITAVNLAVSLAQSNRRILLVDADLRRPRAAALCRTKRIPGLAEVLIGEAESGDVVQKTAQDNFFVVASGKRPDNPSELLASAEFKDLLQVYSEQYDLVLVDTPPMLAVSDAVVVFDAVDAVIMPLRINKHGREAAALTKQLLNEHNMTVVGLIVNWLGSDHKYYGYKHRSADHGYYTYRTDGKYAAYYANSIDVSASVSEEADAE